MESILGGILIGAAVSLMLLFNGRVTGISGILGDIIRPGTPEKSWRFLFFFGLLSGGVFLRLFHPQSFNLVSIAGPVDYVIAGVLVGFGTLLGNGCTSGHGVCGISRFSVRSIVATITFMMAGILSVVLFKITRGGL